MGLFSHSEKLFDLQDLLNYELKDLYSAETQLLEALPKMEDAAHSSELKKAFNTHLQETKAQRERLKEIGSMLNLDMDGEKCDAMEGLIKEGTEILDSKAAPEVRDAGLIAAAQRVEHYEISGYGTANKFAKQLGHLEVSRLLTKSLDEEQNTDTLLNRMAIEDINKKAINPVHDAEKQ